MTKNERRIVLNTIRGQWQMLKALSKISPSLTESDRAEYTALLDEAMQTLQRTVDLMGEEWAHEER
jgi:hypothetical protein